MPVITLRPAVMEDAPTLDRWDRDPAVIAATTSELDAEVAFGDHDWKAELLQQTPVSYFLIALVDGQPIGALQITDPHEEPTHYWGEVAQNLRAIDIWIGDPAHRGKGYGAEVMRLAHARCFAEPAVTAIIIDPLVSNERAISFYRRLGYVPVGRQRFGDDDCFVHRLDRATWEARSSR